MRYTRRSGSEYHTRKRIFFCQTGERAREREKRATGARSGHGHHSISMETLHWLTEVSGGKGGGAFGYVTQVTDS